MVKRVVLGRSGEERVVDLIKDLSDRASAGGTAPGGNKVLEQDEDMIWTRPDGTSHSVRDIDEELQGAQGRIEDAEQSLADSQVRLDEAEQQIQTTQSDLGTLETVTLPAAVQALEEADTAAQKVLTELDSRLTGVDGPTGDLSSIRESLAEAVSAVESAAEVARTANEAANAASQAALEAAGIAASKGRVIIQETEPVGEDRNAANIWIKPIPDDPATEIEEKAITYVYLEGSNEWVPTSSDELAQAAQNALDAREAAQQAKQRADTAISNAATAQGAAEAAQRTANQATTDAREAHNEAVEAQEKLDALRIGSVNLLDDSLSFRTVSSDTSASRVHTDTDRGGRVEILDSGWRNAYRFVQPWIADEDFYTNAGQQYTLSVDVRASFADPTGAARLTMDVRGTGLRESFETGFSDTGGRWERISVTLTIPDRIGSSSLVFFSSVDYSLAEGDVFEYRDFKLEKGNRGTDWSPSLADQQAVADAAQARAEEAMAEASEAKGLAENAVREVGDTVRNTVIEYAVGSSEAVAPTSGWSTSTPTRTPGSFVWMRTIVTYADGDTSTTSPALLTGNDGAKGDKGATGAKGDKGDKGDRGADGVAGKDGVGLAGTALTYALSTSGTTAPPSGWTAAPPTPIKGRYLWTRTIWTYTDSSTETGYSVAYLATDGAKGNDGVAGKDGVGIKSTAITYAASSSGTTAPSSGWSSQPPAAAAGQYVWTKTVWTYTDNSTETGYSVGKIGDTGAKGATGTKGDKGDTGSTGAQGVSVSSVDPFFRTVSRSSGAPARPSGMTPSGWVTTEPAWNPSNKLYRAERIVYSNGTVSWTVPTLVAAYEGIVQVQTSVNGKNSITRSTSNASGSGVVAGDAWYKVDSNGDTMAMWIWSGSAWVASKVRNEMIDTIDVNKLKVHNDLEVIGDAVIDKLWADGIAAKAAVFNSLTVAASNIYPDPRFETKGQWNQNYLVAGAGHSGGNAIVATGRNKGTYELGTATPTPVPFGVKDAKYRVTFWYKSSVVGSYVGRINYGRIVDGVRLKAQVGKTVGADQADTWYQDEIIVNSGSPEVSGFFFGFYSTTTDGFEGTVTYSDLAVTPLVGAVMIEDGAITTPKLTVTGDMSAAIVNAMTTNTKKLVVTEEAILNHATLIGQTVVDDINVQGKLVGTDGVFTGTVDFENINVTNEVLASKISGEHLYGTVVEGGEIVTTNAGNGQITLSDTGFIDPANQAAHPGIRVTPADSSGYVTPPGIGPNENGMILTGGRTAAGGRGFSIYTQTSATHSYQRGSSRSNVTVRDQLAYVDANDGTGNRGELRATPGFARVRTGAADGAYGVIEASASYAVAATRDPAGNYMSQIRSNGREAFLWSTGSDGLGRILSVDSKGVWVKMERSDGSGDYDFFNLDPKRNSNPFSMPSGWVADGSSNSAKYTITLGMCYWGGVLKSTKTLPAGWSTLGYAPKEARPREGDQLRALPTSSGKTVLGKIHASTGRIEIWLSQSSSGIFMHFSPFTYLV